MPDVSRDAAVYDCSVQFVLAEQGEVEATLNLLSPCDTSSLGGLDRLGMDVRLVNGVALGR